ncbi:HSP20-like chaperone [Pavlovales sp. CCMP2436]|nr:HSP20-like chaperone [Pavlovales sp. CCMP2436]
MARVVTYVLIPCDDSLPLEERTLALEEDAGRGDPLKEALSPHFRQGKVDPTAVKQQLGGLSNNMDMSMLEMGTVETFPLTRASEANEMSAVTFYLDECGVLKNQPRNERATRVAAECGHSSPLHGDIFVGREHMSSGARQLSDFTVADMSSSAKWMAAAAQQNFEHAVATKKMHDSMNGTFQHINIGEDEGGTGLPGGTTEVFSWSQTKEELELRVPIPRGAKAKDCKVKFTSSTLSVAVAGSPAVLNAAPLHAKVRPDDCTWSIAGEGDERALMVTLEKVSVGGWPELLAAS